MQLPAVIASYVSVAISWMLPLRFHAGCQAAVLQICHSVALQCFLTGVFLGCRSNIQESWLCFHGTVRRVVLKQKWPTKRCGGQMRKRLDGGVRQGGCSGLGFGALESLCEG